MLRHLAHGTRDYSTVQLEVMTRNNWEFYANLSGRLRPTGPDGPEGDFVERPALWLYPPGRAHGWESAGPFERAVFHFSSVPDPVREASEADGFLEAALTEADVESLRRLAAELAEHHRAPGPVSLLHFDRALIDLSLILLRDREYGATRPLETAAVERVERAVEWYLAHIEERPTLAELAERAHLSPAHLRRQFRAVYGESPHRVLTGLRLEKATRLLAATDDTLEVVASRSGFGGASDLCRVFKAHFKVYPNEWRTTLAARELPWNKIERLVDRVGRDRGEPEYSI